MERERARRCPRERSSERLDDDSADDDLSLRERRDRPPGRGHNPDRLRGPTASCRRATWPADDRRGASGNDHTVGNDAAENGDRRRGESRWACRGQGSVLVWAESFDSGENVCERDNDLSGTYPQQSHAGSAVDRHDRGEANRRARRWVRDARAGGRERRAVRYRVRSVEEASESNRTVLVGFTSVSSFRMTVDSRGLVGTYRLLRRLNVQRRGKPTEITTRVRYADVGATTVSRPPWYDAATNTTR